MKNVLIILVVILIIGAVVFTFLRMTHWTHFLNSSTPTASMSASPTTASVSATATPSASVNSVNGENKFFQKEFATPTPVRRSY